MTLSLGIVSAEYAVAHGTTFLHSTSGCGSPTAFFARCARYFVID